MNRLVVNTLSVSVLGLPVAAYAQSSVVQLTPIMASAAEDALPVPYAGGQLARGGGLGVLGSSDVMDTPFSTTNYTSQFLNDQQARTLADVVVNEASVRVMTSTGSLQRRLPDPRLQC
ncbi:TonB-dependent siderophore receptor [Advenella kashmirensis WT001]|uniref:TonB-dependent siderophore receptor n=2 Tax=Advenella kashmirensis TaxID=310575 RepID=I3UF08_ADVKW|nr:TonB-dependent siderophore receptor [Advenella kashmirensis WT001]